jgi:hypothetical protein
MKKLTLTQALILIGHGLVGWALCAAVIGIGLAVTSLPIALTVHAVAAPVIFAGVAWVYFTRFNFTLPLYTAEAFALIVVFMDVFVVAMIIQKNFDMFQSFTGSWLPFILIFFSTLLTGTFLKGQKKTR